MFKKPSFCHDGEDDVDERLEKKKKTKKLHKKKKKEKKKKKKKDSSSSSESSGDEWMEAPSISTQEPPKMEELEDPEEQLNSFLNRSSAIADPTEVRNLSRNSKKYQQILQESRNAKLRAARELNPTALEPREMPVESKQEEPSNAPTSIDPNRLAAKILRAELAGNMALARRLKDKQKASKNEEAPSTFSALPKKIEQIFTRDRYGRRVEVSEEELRANKTAGESDFMKDVSKSARMMGALQRDQTTDFAIDDLYDAKDDCKSKKRQKTDSAEQSNTFDPRAAIATHKAHQKAEASCSVCRLLSESRYAVVCESQRIALMIPVHKPLVPLQCVLVGKSHQSSCSASSFAGDRQLAAEMSLFQRSLELGYRSQKKVPIFAEHAFVAPPNPKASHLRIDCFPLPANAVGLAKSYFKKSIQDCDSAWATNKQLVTIKSQPSGPISAFGAIPSGFPYVAVTFGDGSTPGLGHVIEDSTKVSKIFVPETIAGIVAAIKHDDKDSNSESSDGDDDDDFVTLGKRKPLDLQEILKLSLTFEKFYVQPGFDWTKNKGD